MAIFLRRAKRKSGETVKREEVEDIAEVEMMVVR